MYLKILHKINGGIKLNLRKEILGDKLDKLEEVENSLEELSLYMINILKVRREKGLIGEEEYIKHAKLKEEYLAFLQQKRKGSAAI